MFSAFKLKVKKTSNKIFRMVLKDLFDKCLNSYIFNLGVTLFKQAVNKIGREKVSECVLYERFIT